MDVRYDAVPDDVLTTVDTPPEKERNRIDVDTISLEPAEQTLFDRSAPCSCDCVTDDSPLWHQFLEISQKFGSK